MITFRQYQKIILLACINLNYLHCDKSGSVVTTATPNTDVLKAAAEGKNISSAPAPVESAPVATPVATTPAAPSTTSTVATTPATSAPTPATPAPVAAPTIAPTPAAPVFQTNSNISLINNSYLTFAITQLQQAKGLINQLIELSKQDPIINANANNLLTNLLSIESILNQLNVLISNVDVMIDSLTGEKQALTSQLQTKTESKGLFSGLLSQLGSLVSALPFGGILNKAISGVGTILDAGKTTTNPAAIQTATDLQNRMAQLNTSKQQIAQQTLTLINTFITIRSTLSELTIIQSKPEILNQIKLIEQLLVSEKDDAYQSLDDSLTKLKQEIEKILITRLEEEYKSIEKALGAAAQTTATQAAAAEAARTQARNDAIIGTVQAATTATTAKK